MRKSGREEKGGSEERVCYEASDHLGQQQLWLVMSGSQCSRTYVSQLSPLMGEEAPH